jgi:hypothetical protein
METRRSYTPRKRRRARARALPDAGGRGFLMRACRLVVYLYNLINITFYDRLFKLIYNIA